MNNSKLMTYSDIHARISWPNILPRLGIAAEFLRNRHGPCPACGGKDRFRFDNRDGRGSFFCNGCGGSGDGFSLLMRVHGCDLAAAREMVMVAAGLSDCDGQINTMRTIKPKRSTATPDKLEWNSTAESIWRKTQGLRGTLGEIYLRSRNCMLPPRDSHLRYLPPDGTYPPSLCAAITDAVTAKPISLHFTRLAADGTGKAGTERDKTLLKGHRKAGGCIRLWPDECVTTGLGIAEGVETCLAVAHAFTPIWSCIDSGNLAGFPLLNGIESLRVFVDNDIPGIRAARTVGQRWADAGREATLIRPTAVGADFCDVVNA